MAGNQETYDKVEAIEKIVHAAVYPLNWNGSHALCNVGYGIGNGELFHVVIVEPDTALHYYSVEGDGVASVVRSTFKMLEKIILDQGGSCE
jgi:hypothetical protein